MTEQLEDVLRRFGHALKTAGEAEAAQELLELTTAVAAASELMAALDRDDMAAAEFHSELLTRQVSGTRPLMFRIR